MTSEDTYADIEIKSANEWMREASSKPVPRMLLGGLWLEGELAVVFGETGVGKSILATAIAEGIARGRNALDSRPVLGGTPAASTYGVVGEVTARPQRVLYVDLDLSGKQFEMRYTADHDPAKGERLTRPYRFSERFRRGELTAELGGEVTTPARKERVSPLLREGGDKEEVELRRMLTALVVRAGARVLIVDSISHLKRTADDTRGWAIILRALKCVKDDLGISVLAIANTLKRSAWRPMAAGDVLGSRSIASYADNIFAIGRCRTDPELRYIKHIRPRSGELVHGTDHVPVFRIAKSGGNFLGFEFERFAAESDLLRPAAGSDRKTISEIRRLSDAGLSIRQIAAELRLSKSAVHRYLHSSTAPYDVDADEAVDPQPWNYFPGREEFEAATNDPRFDNIFDSDDTEAYARRREAYLIEAATARALKQYRKTGRAPTFAEAWAEVMSVPDAAATGALAEPEPFHERAEDDTGRTAAENLSVVFNTPAPLKHSFDSYGREIFVETEDEQTGKPAVWYQVDRKGNKFRKVRDGTGIVREQLFE